MPGKEATARIKINKLLEAAGWRFFPEANQQANIRLEPTIKIRSSDIEALGDDFEKGSIRVSCWWVWVESLLPQLGTKFEEFSHWYSCLTSDTSRDSSAGTSLPHH